MRSVAVAVALCCFMQLAAAQKLTGNMTSGITCTTGEGGGTAGVIGIAKSKRGRGMAVNQYVQCGCAQRCLTVDITCTTGARDRWHCWCRVEAGRGGGMNWQQLQQPACKQNLSAQQL